MPTENQNAQVQKEIDWSTIKTTIGADPEFVFEHKRNFISADYILSDNERCGDFGSIGTDGHSATAELRPHYANTPIGLVENIQNIFAQAILKYPVLSEIRWLSGCYKHDEPIGGHIHFGIDYYAWDEMKLSTALDLFLSTQLMQLEIATEARERKESYGELGNVRAQDWGTEYRVPSSWLHSPALALAVISLGKHIVNQALIDRKFFSDNLNRYLALFGTNYINIKSNYAEHNVNFFKGTRDVVWNEINSWPVAPDVEDGLKIFQTMLDKGYKFGRGDFKTNWGLNIEKGNTVKKTSLENIWGA